MLRGNATVNMSNMRLQHMRAAGRTLPDHEPPRLSSQADTMIRRDRCPHLNVDNGQTWIKEYRAAGSCWKRCQLDTEACRRRWKWSEESSMWVVCDDETPQQTRTRRASSRAQPTPPGMQAEVQPEDHLPSPASPGYSLRSRAVSYQTATSSAMSSTSSSHQPERQRPRTAPKATPLETFEEDSSSAEVFRQCSDDEEMQIL